MIVRFKKTHPNAVLPFKKYSSDFCYDCVATSREKIFPGVYKYGLGFALQVIRDENVSPDTRIAFDIRPRSSIYKTGMILSNSVGTVDENYTNEISAIFFITSTKTYRPTKLATACVNYQYTSRPTSHSSKPTN